MKTYFKKKIKNFFRIFRQFKKIINYPIPIYTERKEGIRLHLGSGEINLQGWVNIDA